MGANTKYKFLMFILLLMLVSIAYPDDLKTTLETLCTNLAGLFKIVLMLTLVLGIIAYSLGQLMSSEMRARANVWAMGMITAALIAAILYVLIPWLLIKIASTPGSAVTITCLN